MDGIIAGGLVLMTVLAAALCLFVVLFARRDRALKRLLHRRTAQARYGGAAEMPDDENQKLLNRFRSLMDEERIFLDSHIDIKDVARHLGCSRKSLSRAVNSGMGVNFKTALNKFRIDMALKMLSNREYSNYTVEAIGAMCGFANRQAFHSAFRRYVGMPPHKYVMSLRSVLDNAEQNAGDDKGEQDVESLRRKERLK